MIELQQIVHLLVNGNKHEANTDSIREGSSLSFLVEKRLIKN